MKIKTTNLRKIRYYEKKFSLFVNEKEKTYDNADIDFRLDNINNLLIEVMEKENQDIKKDLLSLKRGAEINLIPDNKLSWINKENKRLCYFIWSFLRVANKEKIKQLIEYNPSVFSDNKSNLLMHFSTVFGGAFLKEELIYETLNLHNKPCDINEIHKLIIDYIDDVELTVDEKEKLINNIYYIWSDIEKNEKHSWIDKNNFEQLQWIIDYLYKSTISIDFIPVHANKCQMYHAIISAIDLWDEHDTSIIYKIEKKPFINKMKKSWKQKQYRDNLKNEHFSLSSTTLKKLEFISKNISKSHTKTIELIIDEKYKEIISQ